MTDLLPCPFCGESAERITIGEDEDDPNFGGDVIQCSRCLASSHVEFEFKENLVSAWNTRSDKAARKAAFEEAAKVANRAAEAAADMAITGLSEHARRRESMNAAACSIAAAIRALAEKG